MAELVTMGALVPCEVFAPARVLDKGVCEDPVQAVLTRASERRCCIFAPDAAQAVRIATELTAAHHRTVAVLDGMGRDERRSVRQRLSAGEVQSLVTVRALQKGFDAPLLDCAVLTTHGTVTTYLQSVGRVLRACAGKAGALVLDLRGAVYLHGLPADDRVWSLEGAQGRAQTERLASLRRCNDCHAVFPACKRCPRCGSLHVVDPRPMRVQRAEMFAASEIPVEARAQQYIAATVRAMVRNSNGRMPEYIAVKRAREKAPSWVKTALENCPTVNQSVKRSA
jgi:superfamily II DNA or RNA helicase